jgi:UDP-4-amino-4,6-dideoxy-N-acetyl-beta-L-altrosamine transaminase
MIPYGKQDITDDDIAAVIDALKSDFLTQGPAIKEFEESFARYTGSKYAVAVSNGTAALHLSALALDVSEGDKVITSPITFAASANCVRYCGGEVVFADIDPETYLIDITKVEKLLRSAPKGTYKGIIPVDLAGRAVDLEAFRKLADEFGCWIIEDACHAPGAYFTDSTGLNQNSGNSNFADLAIFSFHPVKHIATGEGGMITTNNENLYSRLLALRTHGITRNPDAFQNDPSFASGQVSDSYPGWYMEMQMLGYNYRITDFQCALGSSQLKRAESGLKRRRQIASTYNEFFADKNYIIRQSGNIEGHAYHLYVIEVEDRLGLYEYLKQKGIFSQVHYIPCHLMPYYRELGWKEGDMPHSEQYYKHCLSLPMYPTLTVAEQDFVLASIQEYFTQR